MRVSSEVLGQGRPIVLLHGWGFHSSIMKPLAEALATDYAVTLIDLPGYGRSPADPTLYSLETQASRLLPAIPQGAVLVGWSLGGLLALQVASMRPDCKGVVMLGSTPRFVRDGHWPGIDSGVLTDFKAQLLENVPLALQRFAYWQSRGKAYYRHLLAHLDHTAHRDVLCQGLNLLQHSDLRIMCQALNMPIKFVFASHDPIVPAQLGETIQWHLPQAEITVLPDTCHAGCILKTNSINAIIREFIGVKRKAQSKALL